MKGTVSIVLVLSMVTMVSGCATLGSHEKAKLEEVKACGFKIPHEEIKNPGTAGVLNVFLGFGNFYLAVGTDESSQWAYGFLNLLTWPISIIWGIPEAAIDADVINKKNTVYYYTFRQGKQELENCQAKMDLERKSKELSKQPASPTQTNAPAETPVVAPTAESPAGK